MGQRTITFALDEYYHVYNRGTDKRTIFLDPHDYKRLIELLFLCNSTAPVNVRDIYRDYDSVFSYDRSEQLVAIGAYCLMPNHFHILLTPVVEGGVTKFMNKLGTSYSMYFNRKYQRTGALFQGRFKGQHASEDNYLKYLYAYIHLNPVKLVNSDWKENGISNPEKVFDYLRTYSYSSMFDYLGMPRRESAVLNTTKFPDYFKTASQHQKELVEWLMWSA